MANKKNLQDVSDMLAGEHSSQKKKTFGFSGADSVRKRSIKRAVGEKWEETDKDGNVIAYWEQKDGYRVKSHSSSANDLTSYLYSYPNCDPGCSKPKTRLDAKFKRKFGRCTDCQFEFEHKLKIQGKFKEYERERMKANAEAYFKDSDVEMNKFLESMVGDYSYANADGRMENWSGASKEVQERLEKEYAEYKQHVGKSIEEYS